MAFLPWICPVRGCGEPLAMGERTAACPRGHAFDRARSGYWNLLQPQDRRSREPGDSREVVAARRRFLAAGHEAPFAAALREVVAALPLPARPAVLDVGCGTGHMLAQIALFRSIRPHGVDLAVVPGAFPEIPITTYDGRTLPFPDHAFDATMFCYVMHHLLPDQAAALFQDAVRVTRRRVFLIEDSMAAFGPLYRLRNRLHRIEAGLRYRDYDAGYQIPPDEAMFKTHGEWRTWLGTQPGVARVEVESFAEVSQYDHHTLLDVALHPVGERAP